MKITEEQTVRADIIVGYECDLCHQRYTDIEDMQEFINIADTGGYSSTLGDGVRFELDICSLCFKLKLGNYVRFT